MEFVDSYLTTGDLLGVKSTPIDFGHPKKSIRTEGS
jgi:hypothetical protein